MALKGAWERWARRFVVPTAVEGALPESAWLSPESLPVVPADKTLLQRRIMRPAACRPPEEEGPECPIEYRLSPLNDPCSRLRGSWPRAP